MKRGTTTINLTFEIEYTADGQSTRILAIRSDGHLVDVAKEPDLWHALPEGLRDQIERDAWEDAVDEGTPMWQAQQAASEVVK